MNRKTIKRNKWLTIRLNVEEDRLLNKLFQKTTCNSLSEYARDVLLKKPVYILHRNASADDLIDQMIELKKELNAIGNNFNQAVHKLHLLDQDHQVKAWAAQNEFHSKIFFSKLDEIKEKMNEAFEIWSQK